MSNNDSVSDKCIFPVMQKFKLAAKNCAENAFLKNGQVTFSIPRRKNLAKISLFCNLSKINALYTKIQDDHQKWQENHFLAKSDR